MSLSTSLRNAKEVQRHLEKLGEESLTPEVRKAVASFSRTEARPSIRSLFSQITGRGGTSIVEKQGARIEAKRTKGKGNRIATIVSFVVGVLANRNPGWILPILRWQAFGTDYRYTRSGNVYRGRLRRQLSDDAFADVAKALKPKFLQAVQAGLKATAQKANR